MNIFDLDISNGLVNHEIGAGEYIMLVEAPTAANVTVKANQSFKNGVPLKQGHSLRARKEVRNIYISCDAIANSSITLMQADREDDFELTTPPSSVDVDLIGGYEQIALNQLGKMFEPYEEPVTTNLYSSSPTDVTIFNKVLTCDKITIRAACSTVNAGGAANMRFVLDLFPALHLFKSVDGTYVGTLESKTDFIEIYNVRGKTLTCNGSITASGNIFSTIQEYTLKA